MPNNSNRFREITIPGDVLEDKKLSDSSKIMYGKIARLSYKDGYCWASNSFLDGTNSGRNASRSIAELRNAGYIVIENDRSKFRKIRLYPIVSKVNLANSGEVENSESADLANSGEVENSENANLANSGEVENSESADLANSGEVEKPENANLANSGEVENSEGADLANSGEVEKPENANLANSGEVEKPENANLASSGEVENSENANLANSGEVENSENANLANSGEVENPENANLANSGEQTSSSRDIYNKTTTTASCPKKTDDLLPAAGQTTAAQFSPEELKQAMSVLDKKLILRKDFYPNASAFMSENGLDKNYLAWIYLQCEIRNPDSFDGYYFALFFAENMVEKYKVINLADAAKAKPPPLSCPACGADYVQGEEKCPSCGLSEPSLASNEKILFYRKLHSFSPEKRSKYKSRENEIYSICGHEFGKLRAMLDALNQEYGLPAGV